MADARHKLLFIRVLLEVTNFLALREIEFCVALLSLHNVSLEILVLSRTRLVILFDNVSVVAAARPLNLLVLFACARIILGAQRPLLGQILQLKHKWSEADMIAEQNEIVLLVSNHNAVEFICCKSEFQIR